MAESATLKFTATGGLTASGEKTYTGDERVTQSFTVADSVTDQQRTLNIDITEMQMVYIVSDQDILMEWNDGAGAQGSISLKAGVAFIELVAADQYHVALMSVDVTDLYFTNSSGSTATIQIVVIQNNTP